MIPVVLLVVMFIAILLVISAADPSFLDWNKKTSPTVPPITQRMNPADFIARLRAENPPWVNVSMVGAAPQQIFYRFRFRSTATNPTLCEVTVSALSFSRMRKKLASKNTELELLFEEAQWISYCTEICGWCGWCVPINGQEGRVKNPLKLLDRLSSKES